MHKDSTIHIIKCLLRYSQHNFLKHSVNSYGKITLAKILGHFWLVIICWEHYRCQSKHQSHEPSFVTAARWSRRIKSKVPRRRWMSQRQSWERCCCLVGSWGEHLPLIEQRDTHIMYGKTQWTEGWINFPSTRAWISGRFLHQSNLGSWI